MKRPYYIVFGMVIFLTKKDAQNWWLTGFNRGKQFGIRRSR